MPLHQQSSLKPFVARRAPLQQNLGAKYHFYMIIVLPLHISLHIQSTMARVVQVLQTYILLHAPKRPCAGQKKLSAFNLRRRRVADSLKFKRDCYPEHKLGAENRAKPKEQHSFSSSNSTNLQRLIASQRQDWLLFVEIRRRYPPPNRSLSLCWWSTAVAANCFFCCRMSAIVWSGSMGLNRWCCRIILVWYNRINWWFPWCWSVTKA